MLAVFLHNLGKWEKEHETQLNVSTVLVHSPLITLCVYPYFTTFPVKSSAAGQCQSILTGLLLQHALHKYTSSSTGSSVCVFGTPSAIYLLLDYDCIRGRMVWKPQMALSAPAMHNIRQSQVPSHIVYLSEFLGLLEA